MGSVGVPNRVVQPTEDSRLRTANLPCPGADPCVLDRCTTTASPHTALVETALRCHLPKPNNIRCGNWERKPLDGAQRR